MLTSSTSRTLSALGFIGLVGRKIFCKTFHVCWILRLLTSLLLVSVSGDLDFKTGSQFSVLDIVVQRNERDEPGEIEQL
jgi:hypothetical protein